MFRLVEFQCRLYCTNIILVVIAVGLLLPRGVVVSQWYIPARLDKAG